MAHNHGAQKGGESSCVDGRGTWYARPVLGGTLQQVRTGVQMTGVNRHVARADKVPGHVVR